VRSARPAAETTYFVSECARWVGGTDGL
jgi:hypothetical protein